LWICYSSSLRSNHFILILSWENINPLGAPLDCGFYFENENPDSFNVENFTREDFYNVVYKNDKRKLSRVKLVTPNYTPAVHDFVYATNKADALLFYYIVKDSQEEQKLFYHD